MSHPHESRVKPVPLFGICDLARHCLRPVVVATTTRPGHEEFEIMMVCSRCGYARNARQLQQASEQLALEVLEEIAQSEDKATGDTAEDELETGSTEDAEKEKDPGSRASARKKVH